MSTTTKNGGNVSCNSIKLAFLKQLEIFAAFCEVGDIYLLTV